MVHRPCFTLNALVFLLSEPPTRAGPPPAVCPPWGRERQVCRARQHAQEQQRGGAAARSPRIRAELKKFMFAFFVFPLVDESFIAQRRQCSRRCEYFYGRAQGSFVIEPLG
ncbi:unnamed protein product [Prorocentrum cordatum]|uniref:Secreted protein n=1 Tax=Prorocentrum cordatum TaxID=2364126 RepID=A0ABN9RAN6_9DINO|nr:unnamed protein product [Polarella glacialis]